MRNFIHTCTVAYILVLALSTTCRADVITGAMSEDKGSFEGYKDSKFVFKTEKGRTLELSKASVRTLTLEEPRKVSFLRKGKSDKESAMLLGYDKLQFSFMQKKTKMSISAMNVISIRAEFAAVEGEEAGGTTSGDTLIPAIDTTGFDEEAMTASQKSALASYTTVRGRYDTFLTKSTALVREMDRSSGATRENLLSELRRRKNEEQPIRLQMSAAHKNLLAAFPSGIPQGISSPPAYGLI